MSSNKPPLFNGDNFSFWSIRMRSYLMELGCDVWKSIINGYKALTTASLDMVAKKLNNDNVRDVNAILGGLSNFVFVKFMHCNSTKDIWEKLEIIYEGNDKVKQAKLQTYRGKFQSVNMKEEENIAKYLLRVDEIVNTMRGLGEEVDDKIIIQRVLRSLPLRYDANISSIEDREHLDKLAMDELHGILIAYEMIIDQERPSRREVSFKSSKRTKNYEHMSNESPSE